MNPNQLMNGFGRHFMRSIMRIAMAFGITKGIELLATRGKDPEQMTDEERQLANKTRKNSRQAIKRARQAARITRRIR
ncbi:MAG: hypothetical protein ACK5II_15030 [Paracoccus sp. (in: a-proteobacteria)]